MNETKKIKFPIASIFTAILAFGLLTNLQWLRAGSAWMDGKIGYRMVVEFGRLCSPYPLSDFADWQHDLAPILLFMRKRNGICGTNRAPGAFPRASCAGVCAHGRAHLCATGVCALLCAGKRMLHVA